jgi:hypothetical protein
MCNGNPARPRATGATNYTSVSVAQGIAYVDFGSIEPTLFAAIAKTAKDGQAAPKGLDGALLTRVAMSVDMLALASADSTSLDWHERCAAAETEGVSTRAVPNSKC